MINIVGGQAILHRSPPHHAAGLPLLPTELAVLSVEEDHLDTWPAAIRELQEIARCDFGALSCYARQLRARS